MSLNATALYSSSLNECSLRKSYGARHCKINKKLWTNHVYICGKSLFWICSVDYSADYELIFDKESWSFLGAHMLKPISETGKFE